MRRIEKILYSLLVHFKVHSEAISSNMTKVEMAKDIQFQKNVHFTWKNLPLNGAISIKIGLQNCSLQTGRSISYVNQFWLNPNGKTFSRSISKSTSHLQLDIFCHFDFCHNRRNCFSIVSKAFWSLNLTFTLIKITKFSF